eukprot:TRINITY_DN74363_c0_g1_i1.p1 TRINITY_DN74363_c0_g1~~TRINITY_DN74363_c0_g1_i1.p1  ORF type:complete len:311 (+),score=26.73 TRINITY_DN74363_c0_g1_i1:191-1123(+)
MADLSDNKIYVGGLAPETSNETLEAHFSQYGEIVDCVVMIDKGTNRSRGFGFVTYREASSVNAALGTSNVLDGREVSCKKAMRDHAVTPPASGPKPMGQEEASNLNFNVVKIFVGGLPASCDYDKLTSFFSRFGEIQDAIVMMDSQTQRHRGFGYVTFVQATSVEAAITNYSENRIDGKWVEVKRCIPQEYMRDGTGGKGGSRGKASIPSRTSAIGGSSLSGNAMSTCGGCGAGSPYGAYGAYGGAQDMYRGYGGYDAYGGCYGMGAMGGSMGAGGAYPGHFGAYGAYATAGAVYGAADPRYAHYRPGPY